MTMIFEASTGLGASNNTSRFLRPMLLWLMPHLSADTFEAIHTFVRKCAHATEYAVLALLLWRALRTLAWFKTVGLRREIVLVILLSALYASSDEFHQLFVSDREGRVQDVLLDTSGACLGVAAVWVAGRFRRRT